MCKLDNLSQQERDLVMSVLTLNDKNVQKLVTEELNKSNTEFVYQTPQSNIDKIVQMTKDSNLK